MDAGCIVGTDDKGQAASVKTTTGRADMIELSTQLINSLLKAQVYSL